MHKIPGMTIINFSYSYLFPYLWVPVPQTWPCREQRRSRWSPWGTCRVTLPGSASSCSGLAGHGRHSFQWSFISPPVVRSRRFTSLLSSIFVGVSCFCLTANGLLLFSVSYVTFAVHLASAVHNHVCNRGLLAFLVASADHFMIYQVVSSACLCSL